MQGLSAQEGHRAFVRAEPRGAQVPDADTIHAFFEQYGEVHDVYIPVRTPDICYVTFKHAQSLDEIVGDAAGGITMIGTNGFTISRAMPRGAQAGAAAPAASCAGTVRAGGGGSGLGAAAAASLASAAGAGGGWEPQRQSLSDSSTRIYVTGPVQEIGEELLRDHFGQFGAVKDVYIPLDHVSGQPKPFAFVTMNSAEEQQMVLALATHQLTEEYAVNVCYAAPRSGGKGGDGKGLVGNGFGGVSADDLLQEYQTLGAAPHAGLGLGGGYIPGTAGVVSGPPGTPDGPKQGVPGDHRIIVLGMPDGLNADMLRGHFARHGEIFDIYIPVRTPDIAYITFGTEVAMVDALSHSGFCIAGFDIAELKQAVPKEKGGKGAGKRMGPY